MLIRVFLPQILTIVCVASASAGTLDDRAGRALATKLSSFARVKTLGAFLDRLSHEMPVSDVEFLREKAKGAEHTAIAIDVAGNGYGTIKSARELLAFEVGYKEGRPFFKFNQKKIDIEDATVGSIWTQTERALPVGHLGTYSLLVPRAEATPLVLAHLAVASGVGLYAQFDGNCTSYHQIAEECPHLGTEEKFDRFVKLAKEVNGGKNYAAWCQKDAQVARRCMKDLGKRFSRLLPQDLKRQLELPVEAAAKPGSNPIN